MEKLGMGKTGGFPANSMTQYAALMYCQWLYKKTGIFYRLPTEAEWEYNANLGLAYSFGEDERQLAKYTWYKANMLDINMPQLKTIATQYADFYYMIICCKMDIGSI